MKIEQFNTKLNIKKEMSRPTSKITNKMSLDVNVNGGSANDHDNNGNKSDDVVVVKNYSNGKRSDNKVHQNAKGFPDFKEIPSTFLLNLNDKHTISSDKSIELDSEDEDASSITDEELCQCFTYVDSDNSSIATDSSVEEEEISEMSTDSEKKDKENKGHSLYKRKLNRIKSGIFGVITTKNGRNYLDIDAYLHDSSDNTDSRSSIDIHNTIDDNEKELMKFDYRKDEDYEYDVKKLHSSEKLKEIENKDDINAVDLEDEEPQKMEDIVKMVKRTIEVENNYVNMKRSEMNNDKESNGQNDKIKEQTTFEDDNDHKIITVQCFNKNIDINIPKYPDDQRCSPIKINANNDRTWEFKDQDCNSGVIIENDIEYIIIRRIKKLNLIENENMLLDANSAAELPKNNEKQYGKLDKQISEYSINSDITIKSKHDSNSTHNEQNANKKSNRISDYNSSAKHGVDINENLKLKPNLQKDYDSRIIQRYSDLPHCSILRNPSIVHNPNVNANCRIQFTPSTSTSCKPSSSYNPSFNHSDCSVESSTSLTKYNSNLQNMKSQELALLTNLNYKISAIPQLATIPPIPSNFIKNNKYCNNDDCCCNCKCCKLGYASGDERELTTKPLYNYQKYIIKQRQQLPSYREEHIIPDQPIPNKNFYMKSKSLKPVNVDHMFSNLISQQKNVKKSDFNFDGTQLRRGWHERKRELHLL